MGDVVYFDPCHARRIDGLAALRGYCGSICAGRFERIEPCAQQVSDAAALTSGFVSWSGTDACRRTCAEVFRRGPGDGGWRLIQAHWSWILPRPAGWACPPRQAVEIVLPVAMP